MKLRFTLRAHLVSATSLLFLTIIPIWSEPFFKLLLILLCIVSAKTAYKIRTHENLKLHLIPLIAIALLYNPVFPVDLARIIWIPINVGIGVYFILLIQKSKSLEKNRANETK